MIRKFFAAVLAAALSVVSAPGIAQSSAQPVLPGMLVTSGCPSGVTSCWVPYSNTNPLPTTGGGGGGSNAAAVAQASTTLGQYGSFTQAATLASAPTYTAGTTNPIWTNTSGALATFFPSAPTVNIGTAPSIAVTGTFWQATQPVSGTFWQATQPVSAVALPLPAGAATETTLSTFSTTTHADLIAATPAGTNLIGKVGIDQTTPGTTNAVSTTNFPSTVSTNTGATGASSPRVTVAVDSATVAGSASLPAGTALVGKVGIDQTTPGTTNGVVATGNVASAATDSGNPVKVGGIFTTSLPTFTTGQRGDIQLTSRGQVYTTLSAIGVATAADGVSNASQLKGSDSAGTGGYLSTFNWYYNGSTWDRFRGDTTGFYTVVTPTASANNALVPVVSTTLESCHVLKASAGNLYSLGVTIQATTVIIQVFNATSAPGDGAVTPIWSMAVISNGTLGGDSWNFAIPLRGSTGLTVCASSATTPFTKTASATAMFSGQVQ